MGLAQLLRDDLGSGIGIQEKVPQHLTHRFVGAPVVGSGTGFLGQQRRQAACLKGAAQLVIALATVAVLWGDGADVALAMARDEH